MQTSGALAQAVNFTWHDRTGGFQNKLSQGRSPLVQLSFQLLSRSGHTEAQREAFSARPTKNQSPVIS